MQRTFHFETDVFRGIVACCSGTHEVPQLARVSGGGAYACESSNWCTVRATPVSKVVSASLRRLRPQPEKTDPLVIVENALTCENQQRWSQQQKISAHTQMLCQTCYAERRRSEER